MNIKIKRLHPDAKMPKRGTKYAAGFALNAAEEFAEPIIEEQTVRFQTGRAFEIPEDTLACCTAAPALPSRASSSRLCLWMPTTAGPSTSR